MTILTCVGLIALGLLVGLIAGAWFHQKMLTTVLKDGMGPAFAARAFAVSCDENAISLDKAGVLMSEAFTNQRDDTVTMVFLPEFRVPIVSAEALAKARAGWEILRKVRAGEISPPWAQGEPEPEGVLFVDLPFDPAREPPRKPD